MKLDVASQLSVFPLLSEVPWASVKIRSAVFLAGGNEREFAASAADFDDTGPVSLIRGARESGGQCLFGQVEQSLAGFDHADAMR